MVRALGDPESIVVLAHFARIAAYIIRKKIIDSLTHILYYKDKAHKCGLFYSSVPFARKTRKLEDENG
jgi:hypothetical protein